MDELEIRVAMHCPLCGNDQFESLDVDNDDVLDAPNHIRFRCSDCQSVYTKEDLLKENSEAITYATDEVAKEFIADFEKQKKKAMKKWKF